MSADEFVEREKAAYPVVRLCRVLGILGRLPQRLWGLAQTGTVRAHDARHGPDPADCRDSPGQSRDLWGPTGARRTAGGGACCGHKRVARLMRQAGLAGCHRRRAVHTTRRDPQADLAPDLVRRTFTASAPNRLWVADITYVPTWEGFLYLAVILDAFSPRVVGWSMGEQLHTELGVGALEMAVWKRRPDAGLIHHSDHGCQYTALRFGERCQRAGIRCSMGSVGDCYDNALAESFFATLECELLARQPFHTRTQARTALFEYIEAFYNRQRRHSALDYLSPDAYERRWATTTPVVA